MFEDSDMIILDPSELEKIVLVGNLLKGKEREEQIQFLRENKNTFAWSHEDMVGIDPTEFVHCSNTRSTIKANKAKAKKIRTRKKPDHIRGSG